MTYPAHRVRYPADLLTAPLPKSGRRGGSSARRAWWEVTHPLGCLFVLAVALAGIGFWLAWAVAITIGWMFWSAAVTGWWLVTLPFRRH